MNLQKINKKIEKQKNKPAYIDIQVKRRIGKYILRCIHKPHQRPAKQKPTSGQKYRDPQSRYQGCADTTLHLPILPGTKVQGDHHRTSYIQSCGNCHEYHSYGVRSTHCRQCAHAYKLSGHNTVHNIIKLLEHNTDQHGDGKAPQDLERLSLGHISYHMYLFPSVLIF